MEERVIKGIWFPIEIWEAEDLTWNEKILLMEIDSYTAKGKDCFISDEYVAELIGVSERTASAMISNLIHKGYIRRTRFDGRKRYLASVLAEQLCKICGAETQNMRTTYTNILINEEDKSSSSKKKNRFDFKQALLEIGVSQQTAEDWIQVRKAKKAANTETAFKGICREIAKSGLTAEQCITIAVERSWQGFKAEWIAEKSTSGKKSVLENNMSVAEELMRMQKEWEGMI